MNNFYKFKRFFRSIWRRFYKPANVLKFPQFDPVWVDKDTLLEAAIQKLLVDYVEKEKPFEIVNWTTDEGHIKAAEIISTAYKFFKEEVPAIQKRIDDEMDALYGGSPFDDWIKNLNNPSPEYKQRTEALIKLEDELENLKTHHFIEIVKVRRYLWT